MASTEGLELPPTLRFTKPLLCQLCYVGFFFFNMWLSNTNTTGFSPFLYGTPWRRKASTSFLYIICASQPSAPQLSLGFKIRFFSFTCTIGPANDLTSTISPGLYFILRGAGDGIRTRDSQHGKLVLYQLSYSRKMAGAAGLEPTTSGVTVRCTCLWRLTPIICWFLTAS